MTNINFSTWDYWYDLVYAFFYRRISHRQDVDELTADTLNTFFLKKDPVDNQNAFMWGIARKKFLKYLRNKYQNQSLDIEQIDEPEFINDINYKFKLESLKQCIEGQLKVQDRQIVQLSILEDFKSQEVSTKLDLTPDNVRQRLSRALKKLRQKCKKIWFEN
ncbi:MAG: sigma-70 family RNA polymerase sigma factor [bacterium]